MSAQSAAVHFELSNCNNLASSSPALRLAVKVIHVNGRGVLTLPQEMRRRLGVSRRSQIVAEETDDGILLRAGVTFPVGLYSTARLPSQIPTRHWPRRIALVNPANRLLAIPHQLVRASSQGTCQTSRQTPAIPSGLRYFLHSAPKSRRDCLI